MYQTSQRKRFANAYDKVQLRLNNYIQYMRSKFDRSNKFDLCYYGQVNLLRLISSVAFKCASKHF